MTLAEYKLMIDVQTVIQKYQSDIITLTISPVYDSNTNEVVSLYVEASNNWSGYVCGRQFKVSDMLIVIENEKEWFNTKIKALVNKCMGNG